MSFEPDVVHVSDVLVIGTGVAGLAAALYLDGRAVTVLSKSAFARGGSSQHAQGGVAVALGHDDSPEQHAADTMITGGGLTDPTVARSVTEDGPKRMRELLRLGAQLDRDPDGSISLGREAAHSRRRIVHAAGDATGAELVRTLATALSAADGVRIIDNTQALELIMDGSRVCGVTAVDRAGRTALHLASAIVLATGGIGRLFSRTTNPAECTGDGIALASRAGARLAGLEFVQFHPTALADGSDPMALLTEALRGEGAVLVDEIGRRFMAHVHPAAELAPRDVVARSIWRQRRDGHEVFLDATGLGERLESRFPTVTALCRERGMEPQTQPIPVSPAAHYLMGGIVVDRRGRSSLDGLWACGETACTGLHGANRLASNSLLEALVCGARIGDDLSRALLGSPYPDRCLHLARSQARTAAARPWVGEDGSDRDCFSEAREIMWRWVGVERDAAGLRRALTELEHLAADAPPGSGELANVLAVARLVTRAARARTESRGGHYRSDIPFTSPYWQQAVVFEGDRLLEPEPIVAVQAAG